jgi:hypothetical protein
MAFSAQNLVHEACSYKKHYKTERKPFQFEIQSGWASKRHFSPSNAKLLDRCWRPKTALTDDHFLRVKEWWRRNSNLCSYAIPQQEVKPVEWILERTRPWSLAQEII